LSGGRFRMPAAAFVQRHPRWSAALLLTAAVWITLGMLELAARFLVSYEPSYYTAKRVADGALVYSSTRTAQRELTYPYGKIKINSFGFPDQEFDLDDDRPRIGYIGDSVTGSKQATATESPKFLRNIILQCSIRTCLTDWARPSQQKRSTKCWLGVPGSG
jgi:hypothetical protein